MLQGVDTSDVDATMSYKIQSTWCVINAMIKFKEDNQKSCVISMPIFSAATNGSKGMVQGGLSIFSMPVDKNGATREEYG